MSGLLIFAVCFTAGFILARRFFQPLGWRLFRIAHRNNPEALAFADREDPRS